MIKYLGNKILELIPTFLGVSLLAFLLIRMVPGDPVMLLLGERGADPEVYQEMKNCLGLNRPLSSQYFSFIKNLFKGDLGTSIISKRPVWDEFWDRFPATLELGICGMIFAIVIGIPLGIIAALKRNGPLDYLLMGTSLIGYSMPLFWWGLILILFFSIHLGLTPVSGRIAIQFDIPIKTGFLLIDTLGLQSDEKWPAFWSAFKHLILPTTALGTIPLAITARMTRSSMLEVLGEDYIRTAKAKGLSYSRIIVAHALRNALIPIITVVGLMFGGIITGAILTETIFSWPGIGKWMVASISARDYPVIQSGIMIIASCVIMVNMIVDLLCALANPKLRGTT